MMSSSRPRCARSPSTGRPILPASSETKKIASPGLVPVAKAVFDAHMKTPNQLNHTLDNLIVTAA